MLRQGQVRRMFHSYSPGPAIPAYKSPLPGLSWHCGQISCMYLFLTFLLALSLGRKVLPSPLGLGHNPYLTVGPMLAYIYLSTLISSGTEEIRRKCVINNNNNGKHMVLVVCQALFKAVNRY